MIGVRRGALPNRSTQDACAPLEQRSTQDACAPLEQRTRQDACAPLEMPLCSRGLLLLAVVVVVLLHAEGSDKAAYHSGDDAADESEGAVDGWEERRGAVHDQHANQH